MENFIKAQETLNEALDKNENIMYGNCCLVNDGNDTYLQMYIEGDNHMTLTYAEEDPNETYSDVLRSSINNIKKIISLLTAVIEDAEEECSNAEKDLLKCPFCGSTDVHEIKEDDIIECNNCLSIY